MRVRKLSITADQPLDVGGVRKRGGIRTNQREDSDVNHELLK